MSEIPQSTPTEVSHTRPRNFSEARATFGATFENVLGKLNVTRTQPYQKIKEGFTTLGQHLTEFENAEAQRAETALKNVEAKILKAGEDFDREQNQTDHHISS